MLGLCTVATPSFFGFGKLGRRDAEAAATQPTNAVITDVMTPRVGRAVLMGWRGLSTRGGGSDYHPRGGRRWWATENR